MSEETKHADIGSVSVYVTELKDEPGQYHTVVAPKNVEIGKDSPSKYHTGDRKSSEEFIKKNAGLIKKK